MRPIPAHDFADAGRPFSTVLPSPPAPRNDAPSNFRRSPGTSRAYPFLLITSTLIATAFCFLYITKPVVKIASENPASAAEKTDAVKPLAAPKDKAPAGTPSLLPGSHRLPGDPDVPAPLAAKSQPAFEETNLSVQHVLTARIATGDISRLVLDVPVLYQSRQLRWNQEDVARARTLLARLSDYQEKSRTLRDEGSRLLDEWNQLVTHSIPTAELRADSPSLPVNQRGNAQTVAPAGMDSGETIQLKPAGP